MERARAIYKYALDHVPKHMAQELYKMFISFEKQFGERDHIENVIVGKRRFQYEEELKVRPPPACTRVRAYSTQRRGR